MLSRASGDWALGTARYGCWFAKSFGEKGQELFATYNWNPYSYRWMKAWNKVKYTKVTPSFIPLPDVLKSYVIEIQIMSSKNTDNKLKINFVILIRIVIWVVVCRLTSYEGYEVLNSWIWWWLRRSSGSAHGFGLTSMNTIRTVPTIRVNRQDKSHMKKKNTNISEDTWWHFPLKKYDNFSNSRLVCDFVNWIFWLLFFATVTNPMLEYLKR